MRVRGAPSLTAGALAFCLLVSLPLAAWSEADVKPWASGATPPLRLRDLEGKPVDLATMRGRVVLVNFWATWCEPCREEMPALERLREKLGDSGLEVVTVNFGESDGAVTRFLAKLKISVPVLLDPHKEAADAWKVRGLPMTFLVDADGKARYWSFGEQDWNQGEPLRIVEGLMSEAKRAGR
jgi:thiol-disulfide isomerase/thioredoxin